MMPLSIIEAASEPASGLVNPKQGISRPSARRGSHLSCCSLVPKRIRSSPGPSEFGTITVTAAVTERVEILRTTSECAYGEKPSPPYSFGMIMPKNFSRLMKSQTSSGRSRNSQLIFHSSSIAQSASTWPLRNACSSAVSVAGLERLALGIRHRRQHRAGPGEDRLGDDIAAKGEGAHGDVLMVDRAARPKGRHSLKGAAAM